jgi:hypothetical protein
MIKHGWTGFQHLSALPNYPGREPVPLHARGLPNVDKYHPLRVSGSIAPKHRPRWDITGGTHTPLALCTRVGNPSHRLPTSLCLVTQLNNIMRLRGDKHRLVRNHLQCVIFHRQVSKRTSPPLDTTITRPSDALQVAPPPWQAAMSRRPV